MHVNGQSSAASRPKRAPEDASPAVASAPASTSSSPAYQDVDLLEAGQARRRTIPSRLDAVLDIEADAPEPGRKEGCWASWTRACRAHPWLRYVPIYAACATTIGAYFGIRNYLYLDAAKTFGALNNLRPILLQAHEQIACALQSVQTRLNITDKMIACPQKPLP